MPTWTEPADGASVCTGNEPQNMLEWRSLPARSVCIVARHFLGFYTEENTHTHTYTHTLSHIHTYTHTLSHTHTHTHSHTYTHTHSHTHTYTHTDTHTHTYTH